MFGKFLLGSDKYRLGGYGLCTFDEQFGWVNTVVLAAKMFVDQNQMNSNGEHTQEK